MALAQTPLLPEREPNDTSASASSFEAPARLHGTLGPGDKVDHFVLVVDDDAATQLFEVRLEGPPQGGVRLAITAESESAPSTSLATTAAAPRAQIDALLLAPARYVLSVTGTPSAYSVTISTKRLRPRGLVAGRERARAEVIRASADMDAFILPGGDVWLRWGPAAAKYDLDFLGAGGELAVEVQDDGGKALASSKGDHPTLRGVDVTAPRYLRVSGPVGALVVVRMRRSDAPDGPPVGLLPLVVGRAASGQLEVRGQAHYGVRIDGEAPLYRVRASGPGVKQLVWSTVAGDKLLEARASDGPRGMEAEFDKVSLPTGEHRLSVHGGPGDYTLIIEAVGVPPFPIAAHNLEREPNWGGVFTDELRFGGVRAGFVSALGDLDVYRFYAPVEVAARITITPTTAPLKVRWTNGDLLLKQWEIAKDTPLTARVRVPAGDHELEIAGRDARSIGDAYLVTLELDDWFDASIVEPNDRANDARPFPAHQVLEVSGMGADFYRLPRVAAATAIEVRVSSPAVFARAYLATKTTSDILKKKGDSYVGELPADTDAWVHVEGRDGPASAQVWLGGLAPAKTTASVVSVQVKLADATVAAYLDAKQTLRGEVVVTAKTGGPHTLVTHTSDPGWRVALSKTTLQLDAGKSVTVPFEVVVAPDVRSNQPVRIDVGVAAAGGTTTSAGHVMALATADAAPMRPERAWELPEALLGGIDLVRGGSFVDANGGPAKVSSRMFGLLDGVARRDRRIDMRIGPKTTAEDMPIIKLRTAGPARIVGIALEIVGPEMRTALADFRVSLSSDGKTWTEAVRGRVAQREGEQVFVLAKPLQAQFARLEMLSTHDGVPRVGDGSVTLGAFSVLADPTAPIMPEVDVAAAGNGGFVAWTVPTHGWGTRVPLLADQHFDLIIGFHHARAANIVALRWDEAAGAKANMRVAGLTFYGAVEGPLGPWTKLGQLNAPGEVALGAGTWVRYLRVESDAVAARGNVDVPLIRALETRASARYRSVLGEWGAFQRAAGFEREHPDAGVVAASAKGHQSRATAFKLGDAQVHGRVQRGKVEDWYAVTMGPNEHRLELRAEGQGGGTLDCEFELSDAMGSVVTPTKRDERAGGAMRSYNVTPGRTYHVRVWQPVNSVVFSWDTSGSVSTWVPLVRNAVQRFAETVTPGQEQVHLLPFGGGALLVDWEERSEFLWSALSGYSPTPSSDAETALRIASELLSETRGTKAVVLLTDALSPFDARLWGALAEVRPRVFAAGVAEGLGGVGQDRMES